MTLKTHFAAVLLPIALVGVILVLEAKLLGMSGTLVGGAEVLGELIAVGALAVRRSGSRRSRLLLIGAFGALAIADLSWVYFYYVEKQSVADTSSLLTRIPYAASHLLAGFAVVVATGSIRRLQRNVIALAVVIGVSLCLVFSVGPFVRGLGTHTTIVNVLLLVHIVVQLALLVLVLAVFIQASTPSWSVMTSGLAVLVLGDWLEQFAGQTIPTAGTAEFLYGYGVFLCVAAAIRGDLSEIPRHDLDRPIETRIRAAMVAIPYVVTIVCALTPYDDSHLIVQFVVMSVIFELAGPISHEVAMIIARDRADAERKARVLAALTRTEIAELLELELSALRGHYRPVRGVDTYESIEDIVARLVEREIARDRGEFANKLIDYADQSNSGDARTGLERALTQIPDLDPVIWATDMLSAVRRVCRITVAGEARGTGFLVAPDIVLTCQHVLANLPADETSIVCEFEYFVGGDGRKSVPRSVSINPNPWLLDSSKALAHEGNSEPPPPDLDHLDHAFVRLASRVGDATLEGGATRGWIRLPRRPEEAPRLTSGTALSILQHPGGQPVKVAFNTSAVVQASDMRVRHCVNTAPGSSGSPCFDLEWRVVAVHHYGNSQFNQAVLISAILQRARRMAFAHELGVEPARGDGD